MRDELPNSIACSLRLYRKAIPTFLSILLLVRTLQAQISVTPEYQVKAAFIYNFTRFIDWPATAFSSSVDPFIIGVIGSDPFGSSLTEIVAGEKSGTHPIIVRVYKGINDISDCHILFINSTDAATIKKTIAAVSGKSILTVCNAEPFLKWGGMIRFYKENNKIRMQINVRSAKSAHLKISSKLLNVVSLYNLPDK